MADFPPIGTYPRVMTKAFDDREIIAISKAGMSFFGNSETDDPSQTMFIFDAEVFDIEIIRGSKVIAALVPRGITGEILSDDTEKSQEWTEFNRIFPLGQKKGYISANKLLRRVPGETPYQPLTKAERLRIYAIKDHNSQIRQLMGLQELMAWSSLLTGKMPAILGTTKPSEIYDFRRNAENIINVTQDWVAASLTKILADIDEACDAGRINGKVVLDMLIIGKGAWGPVLGKTGIENYFHLNRLNMGAIDNRIELPSRFKRFVGNGGLQKRGRLVTPEGNELWLFGYNDHCEIPKGTVHYYLPQDNAFLAYSGARADRFFGPSEIMPQTSAKEQWYMDIFGFGAVDFPMPKMANDGKIFDPNMYHFHAYEADDSTGVTTRTQVAPVYASTQTDAFVTLTGLLPAP